MVSRPDPKEQGGAQSCDQDHGGTGNTKMPQNGAREGRTKWDSSKELPMQRLSTTLVTSLISLITSVGKASLFSNN